MDDSIEALRLVVRASVVTRVESLGRNEWRVDVMNAIEDFENDVVDYNDMRETGIQIRLIHSKLAKYELKEAASLLECVLWKLKLLNQAIKSGTIQESSSSPPDQRSNCRIHCGADIVIPNVMSFLLEEEEEYISDDSEEADY